MFSAVRSERGITKTMGSDPDNRKCIIRTSTGSACSFCNFCEEMLLYVVKRECEKKSTNLKIIIKTNKHHPLFAFSVLVVFRGLHWMDA